MKKWFSFNQQTQRTEEITPSQEAFSNSDLLYWTRGMDQWVKGEEALAFFNNPIIIAPVVVPEPVENPVPEEITDSQEPIIVEEQKETPIMKESNNIVYKKRNPRTIKKDAISLVKVIKATPEYILIKKGLKPSLFIQIKKNGYKTKLLKIKKINKNIDYFIESHSKNHLNVFIFNKKSLKPILNIINSNQNKKFKSPSQLINFIHNRYSYREKFKGLSDKRKIDFNLIQGLCLGYPLECAKEFTKEIKLGKVRKDRKVYKISKQIAFIGYPEFKEVSSKLAKKWKKAIKKKK